MVLLLGLAILSAFITTILLVPFIDFLYKIKLKRQIQKTRDPFNKRTPVFDKYNDWKAGTPFGGGILIVAIVIILSSWAYVIFATEIKQWELFVLYFALITYGMLGLYDDSKKLVNGNSPFFGLRMRYKFIIQWILALIIASVFYFKLGYSFINIQGVTIQIGILFIPFAAFVIVSFVNAFNITDGLDGLASGLLLICLTALFTISFQILDSTLGVFIAVLLGCVGSFLYFNIYKARLWLGDVGSLSLGAVLAVIGLLTGKTLALGVIGGVFVVEIASSMMQLVSKHYFHRKIFPVAPIHLWLLKKGWEEPKIVMRAWIIGCFLAILGLFIAFIH
jgi:phospho-N-acetylmuramoyl-pentapeptide-transferase